MDQKKDKQITRFNQVVNQKTGKFKIYVAQVDPDALACAFTLKYILETFEQEVVIVYAGSISHPQNLFINNKYNLREKMIGLSDDRYNSKDHQVLVDSSSTEDRRLRGLDKLEPIIVIDHHRGSNVADASNKFIWIEELGAAATLVWELLNKLKLTLPDDKMLATLLALGIYSDTRGLLRANERDRQAFYEIIKLVDESELNQLIDYPIPNTYFMNLSYALKIMKQHNGRLVTGVGHIKSSQGDDISSVADELLRMSSINLVFLWGIIDDKVRISARTSDPSINLDELIKERFEGQGGAKMTPDGMSEGGVLLDLDLGFWMLNMPDKSLNKVRDMIQETMEYVIFQD